MTPREAVLVDAVRTPVGKRGGQLRDWHPTDLLAHTLATLVKRTGLAPERLADVIVGCALQRGEQSGNIARNAVLGAGFPDSLPGTTLDRQCGSGQQAIHFAAQAIRSGEYDFAIGAGVESMSRVDLGPLFSPGGSGSRRATESASSTGTVDATSSSTGPSPASRPAWSSSTCDWARRTSPTSSKTAARRSSWSTRPCSRSRRPSHRTCPVCRPGSS